MQIIGAAVPHDTPLITTIAAGLAFALAGGGLALRLKLPPLVGYLLAGIALGPFTPGIVADTSLAPQIAEIGAILLMFGVGMHFSVAELWATRSVALPGALAQSAVATVMGAAAAWFWGWPFSAGLVFGLALSVASTIVLLRALESHRLLKSKDGHIATGWLIVEDLFTIVILVLLPALAAPQEASSFPGRGLPAMLLVTALEIATFITLMLVAGRKVFHRLLQMAAKSGSHELFTLAAATLALGVAFASATLFGTSFALGAFFAGLAIRESDLSRRAASDLQPLQSASAALFFVAVGMLFDPTILLRQPLRVLLVLLIVVAGKSLIAFGIVLALGHGRRSALIIAAALAQIGEFSFLLAEAGVKLGLMPKEGRDLIMAGALLSITINPFLFRALFPAGANAGLRHPPLVTDVAWRRRDQNGKQYAAQQSP